MKFTVTMCKFYGEVEEKVKIYVSIPVDRRD